MDNPNDSWKKYLVLGLILIIGSIVFGVSFARTIEPLVLPASADLHIGEYLTDNQDRCYILFTRTCWKLKPNGHPIFGDVCQHGVFKVRNLDFEDVLNYESYEIESQEGGFFVFYGYRFDVSFYNDTTVNLVITPQ